jgi:hypothetical protein
MFKIDMKKVFLAFTLFAISTYALSQSAVSTVAESYLTSLLDSSVLFDTAAAEQPSFDIVDTESAWKNWQTVENYQYGKDRGSLPMIADLNSLHPYFRDKIVELIHLCKAQGIELAVVESFRTHAKQAEYFGMGRKYTRSKGGKSKHQYGLAVDVVPIVDSVAVWDNTLLWKKIGVTGERLGLRWGGRWRAPYDPAHFELGAGVSTYHLAKGMQPGIPHAKANTYPCLEEELALLEKYYEAWEAEQAVSARTSARVESPGASGQ